MMILLSKVVTAPTFLSPEWFRFQAEASHFFIAHCFFKAIDILLCLLEVVLWLAFGLLLLSAVGLSFRGVIMCVAKACQFLQKRFGIRPVVTACGAVGVLLCVVALCDICGGGFGSTAEALNDLANAPSTPRFIVRGLIQLASASVFAVDILLVFAALACVFFVYGSIMEWLQPSLLTMAIVILGVILFAAWDKL